MNLAAGTTLATYTLERLLGRGGMGEVYLATDANLGRKVALKVLSPELASDPRFRERFIGESRLAASLDHPHIVPIFEAGEADGRLFLAMRYVEGDDLGALIGGRPLEPARAIELLAGIGAALDAAHDRGLIHRDVKAANILVARTARGEEHAYLADFGLTRQQGSDAGFTKTGQLVGSVDTVAPEQIEGRPIDHRVDVYSLACVLYTALTGKPPYPRDTDMATLWAHVQAEPPKPSDTDPALAPFDRVIARGMAKDPADRTPSAGELLADASQALAGEAVAKAAVVALRSSALPRPLSSFIGRERQVSEVLARIDGGARLISLTGPGGTGKTRLALEVARSIQTVYEGGAYWVDLSPLRDPTLVLDAIGHSFGATDGVSASIGERHVLLVIDNLEQVIEAAPELANLLLDCPKLSLLITSRERLRVQGEVEYPVPPLEVREAVKLFCERAQTEPSPDVAQLCGRLDNLPLAVELAAARASVISPAKILERLEHRLDLLKGGRDADPRQRTLRATIEWSYSLLSDLEQEQFAHLSIFAGGCTLEAAEAIAQADLDTLQSLVDKSLIRYASDRYEMLETIHEFAAERLETTAGDVAARYVTHYLDLAVEADSHLRAEDQVRWLRRLDADYANCVSALRMLINQQDGDRAAQLASSLSWHWRGTGRLREAREYLERVLLLAIGEPYRIHVLMALSGVSLSLGNSEVSRRSADEALASARRISRPDVVAKALLQRALAEESFSVARAKEMHAEALALYEQLGDLDGVGKQTINLGNMALVDGDFVAAAALAAEGHELVRKSGNRDAIGVALMNLATARYFLGDFGSAEDACRLALDALVEIGDRNALSVCLDIVAATWARTGRIREAATLLDATELHRAETGLVLEAGEQRLRSDAASLVSGQADGGAPKAALNSPSVMTLDEAIQYALRS